MICDVQQKMYDGDNDGDHIRWGMSYLEHDRKLPNTKP